MAKTKTTKIIIVVLEVTVEVGTVIGSKEGKVLLMMNW